MRFSTTLAAALAVCAAAAPPCADLKNVTFTAPWGANSWKVDYAGPFLNDRPPHVEVGAANMAAHKAGDLYCLTNCNAATSSAIEYDVVGVQDSVTGKGAHITVFYGAGAKAQLAKYCA